MKRNGFTLVEILATIAIIAVLASISIITYISVKKKSLEASLESKMEIANLSATRYGEANKNEIWESKKCRYVKIKELIEENYLLSDSKDKVEFINPVDNTDMSDKVYEICYNNQGLNINFYNSYDLYLENLVTSISTIQPSFNKNTYQYIVTVPYNTTTIGITATLGKSYMTFKEGYGSRVVGLNSGDVSQTNISIIIKSPDGQEKEYKINIIKEKNKNCDIEELKKKISYTGNYADSWEIFIDNNCLWKIKFYKSGTIKANENLVIDAFLVGGGAGGSGSYSNYTGFFSGGGGGGGYTKTVKSVSLTKNQEYPIVIGSGGAGGSGGEYRASNSGGYTSAFTVLANGGGYASCHIGGSGSNAGGSGYSQYYNNGVQNGASYGNSTNSSFAGFGAGQGTTTCEFGEGTLSGCTNGDDYAYAGGGGGNGSGGGYLGGIANDTSSTNKNGKPNTGGGGGGGSNYNNGGAGGSGIVIIRASR